MDLSKFSDEELMKIAGQQPQTQQTQDLSSMSDEELRNIAGISESAKQIERLSPTAFNVGKALGSGITNYAQKLGTGINQLANELGIEGFSKLAKLSAKIQRPDLVKEIDSYSSKEVTDLITQESKRQIAEREARAKASGLGFSFGVGEIIGAGGLFGGIGRKGALGVGISAGAESLLKPVGKEEGLKERATRGAKAVPTGIAVGYATGKAVDLASNIYSGLKSILTTKDADDIAQTTVILKDKASKVYEAMKNINADITQETSNKIVNELDDALAKSGKLNSKLHGDTLSVLNDLKKVVKEKGKLGLEELDQYRQLLNQVIVKNTDIAGKINPDAYKSVVLIDKLDDMITNLTPESLSERGTEAINLLKTARSDWKTYIKYQKIANVFEKAGSDPNRIKSSFTRFVNNKKNLLGFTDVEKEALLKAAKNTSGEKILKTLGKFGFDFGSSLTPGNTFLPVASIFAGALKGSTTKGALFAGAGTIAREAQKSLAQGKVNEALNIIEKGGMKDISDVIKRMPTEAVKKQMLAKILSYRLSEKINKNTKMEGKEWQQD